MSGHVFIATTGCAGSTLLMAILTKLGMDTGFDYCSPISTVEGHTAFGGTYEVKMYGNLGQENYDRGFPYIMKSSRICTTLLDRADTFNYKIDYVYGLFRDPFIASVKERIMRDVLEGDSPTDFWNKIMKLPNIKDELGSAVYELQRMFLLLCLTVAKHDIPNTMLVYPHCMVDLPLTYKKLEFLMTKYSISYDRFKEVCDELIDQDILDIALGYVK